MFNIRHMPQRVMLQHFLLVAIHSDPLATDVLPGNVCFVYQWRLLVQFTLLFNFSLYTPQGTSFTKMVLKL